MAISGSIVLAQNSQLGSRISQLDYWELCVDLLSPAVSVFLLGVLLLGHLIVARFHNYAQFFTAE